MTPADPSLLCCYCSISLLCVSAPCNNSRISGYLFSWESEGLFSRGLKATIIFIMALYYSRFSSSLATSFTGPGDLLAVGAPTLISEGSEPLVTMPFSGHSTYFPVVSLGVKVKGGHFCCFFPLVLGSMYSFFLDIAPYTSRGH